MCMCSYMYMYLHGELKCGWVLSTLAVGWVLSRTQRGVFGYCSYSQYITYLSLPPPIPRLQDFDPEDFSSTLTEAHEDGTDRQHLLGFMTSSHTPYILNRLNISLRALDNSREEEEEGRASCFVCGFEFSTFQPPVFYFSCLCI